MALDHPECAAGAGSASRIARFVHDATTMERATGQHPIAPKRPAYPERRRAGALTSRAATIERLIGSGMRAGLATAWIDTWDRSTVDLVDFRSAPDFWTLAYEYAIEEYQRGYRPNLTNPAGRPAATTARPPATGALPG